MVHRAMFFLSGSHLDLRRLSYSELCCVVATDDTISSALLSSDYVHSPKYFVWFWCVFTSVWLHQSTLSLETHCTDKLLASGFA